jgi:hypothetical protein
MPSRTIPRMDTRLDRSTSRRMGRSIFGADGAVTTIGTVTSTGMAVDAAHMGTVGMGVADMEEADTGEVTKGNRDNHRLLLSPEAI